MKIRIIIINWILLLTMCFWIIPVVILLIIKDKSFRNDKYLKGEMYLWEK